MYLELAQKYLIKARSTSGATRLYFANLCQVCLAKQGIAPEEIGSSSPELIALQAKVSKETAGQTSRIQRQKKDLAAVCKKYLDQCRQARGASRQYYANLCLSSMAKSGIAPEQIETSEKELLELQSKGLLESAANYLEEARNATGAKRKCYADLCWEYLAKAKASPNHIGATEEELQNMGI